jgi:hypothetical protein
VWYVIRQVFEMVRRLLLVGVFIVVPRQGSTLQLAVATLTAITYVVVQSLARPYIRIADGVLAMTSSVSLVALLYCYTLYKQGTLDSFEPVHETLSMDLKRRYGVPADKITIVAIGSVLGVMIMSLPILVFLFGAEAARQVQEQRAAAARRLRFVSSGMEVMAPAVVGEFKYHVFLSHVWGTGQDQMRIVKQRLLEMLPELSVFLDVDDLSEGKGAEFVDASLVTLVFCSESYFKSSNCLRELLRAVVTNKLVVTLLETDPKHGAITREQIREELVAGAGDLARSGLAGEMEMWGYPVPSAAKLFAALFERAPIIEWMRIGVFQDVTMRLVAEAIFPGALQGRTFLQGELVRRPMPLLPRPRQGKRFHLFCSPHNVGALAMAIEISASMGSEILTTQDAAELRESERMLLYLTRKTWTSGADSTALAAHVEHAMALGANQLLLAHEMPGADDGDARSAVLFDAMFAGELKGGTPERLLRRGVYNQIAIALKGGELRPVSMFLMAEALAKDVPGGVEQPPPFVQTRSDQVAHHPSNLPVAVGFAGIQTQEGSTRPRRRRAHVVRLLEQMLRPKPEIELPLSYTRDRAEDAVLALTPVMLSQHPAPCDALPCSTSAQYEVFEQGL